MRQRAAGHELGPNEKVAMLAQAQIYDTENHLLMHANGINSGAQISAVVAAAVRLSALKEGNGLDLSSTAPSRIARKSFQSLFFWNRLISRVPNFQGLCPPTGPAMILPLN